MDLSQDSSRHFDQEATRSSLYSRTGQPVNLGGVISEKAQLSNVNFYFVVQRIDLGPHAF